MLIKVERAFPLLLFFLGFATSKERIWRFDSDISNPDNWIDGIFARDCKGIHFAPVNSAPVYITELTTPELTLPVDGEIDIIDGGFIEFKDNKKCIKLKPIDYHDWYDPSSWLQPDNNVAIPDQQRIPCTFDDVHFPKQYHTRVLDNYDGSVTVKSIKLGDQPKYSGELRIEMTTQVGRQMFYSHLTDTFTIRLQNQECQDSYGCLCHDKFVPCPLTESEKKVNCLNPVMPEEFCHEICGAYITFKAGEGPTLNEIRKKLKDYTVDTYASRVKDYLNNEVMQVVFSEKEYVGKSLEEAEDFLQFLKFSKVENLQLLKSGALYIERGGSSSISIVFGTLAAVVAFFAILLYLNGDTPVTAVMSKLHRRPRGSIFNVPFFARFDNTDENLIIDSQSEAGSILDIPKSFDNPMFGQGEATSSTHHENPLYDVIKEENDSQVEE